MRARIISDLLEEVFDRGELVRFLDGLLGGETLRRQLPGDLASWRVVAMEAAKLLIRSGHASSPRFWAALRGEREHQAALIDLARQRFLVEDRRVIDEYLSEWTAFRAVCRCIVTVLLAAILSAMIAAVRECGDHRSSRCRGADRVDGSSAVSRGTASARG